MTDPDFTPLQLGRILERLDQQDKASERALTALHLAATKATEETRAIAAALAKETSAKADIIRDALNAHIASDDNLHTSIGGKLDELLEAHARLKGAKAVLFVLVSGIAVVIGWVLSVFTLKS